VNGTRTVFELPDRIRGLGDLAYNLWWSWRVPARELFRSLGLQVWRESGHYPHPWLGVSVLRFAAEGARLLREAGMDVLVDERQTASGGALTQSGGPSPFQETGRGAGSQSALTAAAFSRAASSPRASRSC
jgi:hypothetical protein